MGSAVWHGAIFGLRIAAGLAAGGLTLLCLYELDRLPLFLVCPLAAGFVGGALVGSWWSVAAVPLPTAALGLAAVVWEVLRPDRSAHESIPIGVAGLGLIIFVSCPTFVGAALGTAAFKRLRHGQDWVDR